MKPRVHIDDSDVRDGVPVFGDEGICRRCGQVAPLDWDVELCAACGVELRRDMDEAVRGQDDKGNRASL